MTFQIDESLINDGIIIGEFPLSKLILVNNSYFPWFILVPKVNDAKEIIDLDQDQQLSLLNEINIISKLVKKLYDPDKLNIAALGNIVSQLHVHIVARYNTDEAWPDPVWGKGKKPYSDIGWQEAIDIAKINLTKIEGFKINYNPTN